MDELDFSGAATAPLAPLEPTHGTGQRPGASVSPPAVAYHGTLPPSLRSHNPKSEWDSYSPVYLMQRPDPAKKFRPYRFCF